MYQSSNTRQNMTESISGNIKIFSMLILLCCTLSCTESTQYFHIQVVDKSTGLGVPAVRVTPLSRVNYFTDSQGNIAFNEPGLMDKEVYFEIEADGYEIPKDENGDRALTLKVESGGSTIIRIKRIQAAERLYRITGSGIYRDSELLGLETPLKDPNWNDGEVIGQDSNLGIIHNGKIFYIWGDTFLPPKYIGNFSVAAATADLPSNGGLDPNIGVELTYLTDQSGRTKSMINLDGPGYVWFDWLMHLKDDENNKVLAAKYARVNAFFGNYERGLAIYDENEQIFKKQKEFPEWISEGHTCHHPVEALDNDEEYYLLTSGFRFSRVRPNLSDASQVNKYQYFTCLKENTNWEDRDVNRSGTELIYSWKENAPGLEYDRQKQLIAEGKIDANEGWLQLTDVQTGERIEHVGRGSVYWNEFRKKWILISGSTDTWYGEADTPVGPWHYLTKVAKHGNFLYNPKQHKYYDQEKGRVIFFEGTYTKFLGPKAMIPRYDYNQVMYRLQLDDPRLLMPSPVYRVNGVLKTGKNLSESEWNEIEEIAFFAIDYSERLDQSIDLFNSEGQLTKDSDDGEYALSGIHTNLDSRNSFEGNWDVTIEFEAFENFFKASISVLPESTIKSDNSDFQLEGLKLKNDSIYFDIKHSLGNYQLAGRNIAGEISGKWQKEGSIYKGNWSANSTNPDIWWPMYNGNLVALYQVQNKLTGEFSYQTEERITEGYEKIGEPICMVWSNPFKYLILDSSIRPIIKN